MQQRNSPEIKSKSKYSSINHPNNKSILQNFQIFKCSQNNQANLACMLSKCKHPAFFCTNFNCSCQIVHQKCHYITIKNINAYIINKQKQISQKTHQTYQQIFSSIDQMIDQLSQLRNKFEIQYQYFWLQKQQITYVQLIKQNKVEKIDGKLISSLIQCSDRDIKFQMMTKNFFLYQFQNQKSFFKNIVNQIYKQYSKVDSQKFTYQKQFLKDSQVVYEEFHKQMIIKWVKQSLKQKPIDSQLIFRASQNDFRVKQLYKACKNRNNILIILRNEYGKLMGGFTQKRWQNYKFNDENTYRSFIFSLDTKDKIKFNWNNHQPKESTSELIRFGWSNDLVIVDKANTNKQSEFNPKWNFNIYNNSYYLSKNKYNQDQQMNKQLTGNPYSYKFKIQQYEAYEIRQIL